jgi:hypothetical protein
VAEVYHPQFVDHVNVLEYYGLAGAPTSVAVYLALFPDLRCVVDEQVSEGDCVVSRQTLTGTQIATTPPGPDDARHLGEHRGGILRVVQDHVGERGIDGVIDQRQRGDVALAQIDVVDTEPVEVAPRDIEDVLGDVDPDHPRHARGDAGGYEAGAVPRSATTMSGERSAKSPRRSITRSS